jgi:hypothetical protein
MVMHMHACIDLLCMAAVNFTAQQQQQHSAWAALTQKVCSIDMHRDRDPSIHGSTSISVRLL